MPVYLLIAYGLPAFALLTRFVALTRRRPQPLACSTNRTARLSLTKARPAEHGRDMFQWKPN
jgi:hypothetical protein